MLHPPSFFVSNLFLAITLVLLQASEEYTNTVRVSEAKNCKALDNCISNQIYLSLCGEIQVVWLFINKRVKLPP